jgi:AcrR family transcriptional regulator
MRGDGPTLPLAGVPAAERADAARNRRKILDAVMSLLESGGPDAVTPDAVARTARVGVGTVYRRFGDRSGLFMAILDDRERAFQAAFMSGPPPLGPGAPPCARIRAFLSALVDRIDGQRQIFLHAEKSAPASFRYRGGPYRVYYAHLTALVSQTSPGADTDYLADALLAPVSPALINFQVHDRGMSIERIKAGLEDLVGRVCD